MAPDRGTRQPRRPGHRHGRVTGQRIAPARERADRERGPGTQDHVHAHRHDRKLMTRAAVTYGDDRFAA
jgi:hypothetical protein